jgi:hypothetical protein
MDSSVRTGVPPEPPPTSERTVLFVGGTGAALAGAAALTGLVFPAGDGAASWVNNVLVPARVILGVAGMIVAGAGLSLRPRWPGGWLVAALASLLAGLGFPASWDTFRLVGFVFAGLAAAGAALTALPPIFRVVFASAAVLFHFAGIFTAIMNPPPTPYLSSQLWTVAFRPYLQFAYLNNAYQFYSPDPGPASEAWFCIEYAPLPTDPVAEGPDGKPLQDDEGHPIYKKTTLWVKVPRRDRDFKDPLGQSYYRRLSLTENISHGQSLSDFPTKVQDELTRRRMVAANTIPLAAEMPVAWQYRMPNEGVATILIPSYVRHVCRRYAKPDRDIVGVKVYRVTHNVVQPQFLVGPEVDGKRRPGDPYSPTTYLPYYMGEFSVNGELRYLNDPMLYWLVPILVNPAATPEDFEKLAGKKRLTQAEYRRLYKDYVAEHAQSEHMEGELDK